MSSARKQKSKQKKRTTPAQGRAQGAPGSVRTPSVEPGTTSTSVNPSPARPRSDPGTVLPPASVAELELAVASLVQALQDPVPESPAAPSSAPPPAPASTDAETAPTEAAPTEAEATKATETEAAEPPSAPRRWKLVAAAILVPLCFVGGLLGVKAGVEALSEDTPTPAPATTVAGPSATSGATTPAPAASTTADDAPGGTTGPGLTSPGVLVQVAPDPSGNLEVVERVRFEESSSILTLAPPVTAGIAKFAVPQGIRVSDLQMSADGSVVSSAPTSFTRTTQVDLPPETRVVEMRYRLQGAATRSTPSTPGRALVVLPPISAGEELIALPVIVEVDGGLVRNLQCPGLDPSDQLCGRLGDDRWYTTPLGSGATAVLAQLDLPSPVGT